MNTRVERADSIRDRGIYNKDYLFHRVNGSAGDEFLVWVPSKLDHDQSVVMATRLLDKIYFAQLQEVGYLGDYIPDLISVDGELKPEVVELR